MEGAGSTACFTAQDAGVLVSLVKHAQRTGMAGCKGTWKDFLKVRTLLEWPTGISIAAMLQ